MKRGGRAQVFRYAPPSFSQAASLYPLPKVRQSEGKCSAGIEKGDHIFQDLRVFQVVI